MKLYTHSPKLGTVAIKAKSLKLCTSWYIYLYQNGEYDRTEVNESVCRERAAAITTPGPVCLDIEAFHFEDGDWEYAQAQMLTAIRIYRENLPLNNRLGIYNFMPTRNYWTPVNYHANPKKYKQEMKDWRTHNSLFKSDRRDSLSYRSHAGVADAVDVVFPSLYQFYHDVPNQLVYIKANIKEARRYNKPIIAWVWSQIHGSNPSGNAGEYVGDESILRQLDLLDRMGIEGVVFLNSKVDAPDSFYDLLESRWSGTIQEVTT